MVFGGEEGVVEGEARARSFRYEDYNKRRVFLRSYPLYWEEEEEAAVGVQKPVVGSQEKVKRSMKERVLVVFQWGGRLLLLRKLRHKVAYYLVACRPFRAYNPSHPLVSH
ncbi:hypothetical protein EJ110_NYTH05868 [Nymphaea thermarum]|nr:hypothetical protein EJ110_NYTH05868 [Nymphaea thermarum]